jgi:UDP-N-acetylglucosamine 2-epimerase (non-hydrolysing)
MICRMAASPLTISSSIVLPVGITTDNQSKPPSPGKLNRFVRDLVHRGERLFAVNQPSDQQIRVLVVYGTRPEAIKMAPVVAALRARAERFEPIVCTTAQHRELIDQVQELFGLAPDLDLNLMTPDQSLNDLTGRVITALGEVLERVRPDWLLVQGDTTTAMGAALAAFHHRIPVGHVEAGLRTGDLTRPFPEEGNRRLIDIVAKALFAPTARARDALLAEGTDPGRLFLTGNTVVDALQSVAATLGDVSRNDEVLVTVHRRESFGEPIRQICLAVARLAERFPQLRWIYPVHHNPRVRDPARAILERIPNVELHDPFDYAELLRYLQRARIVLTDSGGIQEEAPAFGTPVLVLREKTERPEGVEAGVARLIGVEPEAIITAVTEVLTDNAVYESMATATNPYGDGQAAARIAAVLAGERFEPFEATTIPNMNLARVAG